MLQQSHRLTLHQLIDHIAQHSPDSVEPLVGLADVGEAEVVEKDLLDDKDCDRFGEFGAGLHDSEAEGDDLGGEEEVDDVGVVVLLRYSGRRHEVEVKRDETKEEWKGEEEKEGQGGNEDGAMKITEYKSGQGSREAG